ncbi:MAG TPA: hypothetical protein PLQ19_01715 [Aeromicrobium sp.]|nr:hypothetical protein [Aeromicrobium sp.]
MAAKLPRSKTSILALTVLILFVASVAYIWTEYGTNRAITLLVAGVAVFALTWLILALVSVLQVFTSKRPKKYEQNEVPLSNTQRDIGDRRPLILDHESDRPKTAAPAQPVEEEPPAPEGGRQPGSRRTNADS